MKSGAKKDADPGDDRPYHRQCSLDHIGEVHVKAKSKLKPMSAAMLL